MTAPLYRGVLFEENGDGAPLLHPARNTLRGGLGQAITEVQIGNGAAFFALVKKREAAIPKNVFCYKGLARG